jgi:DNA-binding transcriptional LysR family regulator
MLRECSQQVDVLLEENTADRLLRNLQEGSLDVVVCRIWHQIAMDGLSQCVLMHESLVVVVGTAHPLAKTSKVTWEEAVEYPWIVPSGGSPACNALEALAATHGLRIPQGRVESISLTLNLALFQMDHFVGLLPKEYALRLQETGGLRVLPLDTDNLLSETRMFWRAEDQEPTTKLFLDCLNRAAQVAHS